MKISDRKCERTGFQEHHPYDPTIDIQTDFIMVYGTDSNMTERIKTWKEKGYIVHLMTGVSWGEYQDYLYGKIDGREHWDEAQKKSDGSYIQHGKDVPYMVPTISFTDYLTGQIKIAVDAGVEAIHLEEPEFWREGGYSDAFKREWELYYGEKWIPLNESADAQYRGSKLKAYLYARCLDRLCSTLKEYAMVKYGRKLRFYVPTHSLINYTQWGIMSPESRLLDIPSIDGYIAQIWTGTSRTENVYEGVRKERTFETAFLEYGIMQELVRGTNRTMWFLHDPIEDNPNHTWIDYKDNYFKTLIASLLHPQVSKYEVVPWPFRVFNGKHAVENGSEKEPIPSDYATVLLTLMNTLKNMDQENVTWEQNNLTVGLLLSDSGMFQRYYPDIYKTAALENSNDEALNKEYSGIKEQDIIDWSAFYGLALPLLKHGVALTPVQLDNVRRFSSYLDDYKVLILSYEFMKPEYPDINTALTGWVQDGGILIYVGDDSDAFHGIRAWWNEGKRKYASPREHLFECMNIKSSVNKKVKKEKPYIKKVGSGLLTYIKCHPVEFSYNTKNAEFLRSTLETVLKTYKPELLWNYKNSFVFHRGPYVIAAVLDESISDNETVLNGRYVDLFQSNLPIKTCVKINPGENILLYDLDYIKNTEEPELIAASSRIDKIEYKTNIGLEDSGEFGFEIIFTAKGPERVAGAARLYSKREIKNAIAFSGGNAVEVNIEWDKESSTALIKYMNKPEGINIILSC